MNTYNLLATIPFFIGVVSIASVMLIKIVKHITNAEHSRAIIKHYQEKHQINHEEEKL